MSETAAAAPTAGKPDETLDGKEAIYARLGEMVKEMTNHRVGKSGGRKIFDAVTSEIFAEATKEGTMRFNGGFGSLHVREYKEGSRRLPSGQTTTFGKRRKLRYEEGVVVEALVANKGNLVEALKVRGSKAAEPATAAVAPK